MATAKLTTIYLLLRMRCPSHVARLVISVVVYAVNGHRWIWRMTDVCKECGEAVTPLLAYSDTPRSVVPIRLHIFVVAAFLHLVPSAVFLGERLGFLLFARLPMIFAAKAAAALRVTGPQRAGKNKALIPAVATTKPSQENPSVRSLMRDDEFAVSSPC